MTAQIETLPSTQSKVNNATPDHINQKIERETEARINTFKRKDPEAIEQRISELEQEWDTERVLEVNMASLALASSIMALTVDKKWAYFSGAVSAFMLQHALQGWCPPLSLIRRMGIRTMSEINLEKQALKDLLEDEHYPI
ncbi:YgaP-like transmembrane domain [Planococcus sp. SE5232]|uniref:YgaP-like transmembrane domain n=1 Tax=unclassified Planococcus (in: firmicutes) TaxID=2662419 RepID=UPI001CC04B8A|nr:YgaP-like transmembrane domain [Planococcus sp. 4-30]